MLQALQILSGFDLSKYRADDPAFVHLVTETLKLVMADRDAWYGDDPDVPIDALLSADYAAERRSLIGREASRDLRPGKPAGRTPRLPKLNDAILPAAAGGSGEPTVGIKGAEPDGDLANRLAAKSPQTGDTCHLDVVDKWGNMVSATPSGGWLQSNPVIPELGFPLGTRAQMFWLEEGFFNSLASGKRPRTTLTPSMAFRDGRPYLAFGTPGGDQQEQWSLLLLLLHIDLALPLQAAIDTPSFHTDHLVASFWPRQFAPGSLTVEGRMPSETVEALRARGHAVTVNGLWSEGRLSACAYDVSGDVPLIRAAANPRGMQGYAVAR